MKASSATGSRLDTETRSLVHGSLSTHRVGTQPLGTQPIYPESYQGRIAWIVGIVGGVFFLAVACCVMWYVDLPLTRHTWLKRPHRPLNEKPSPWPARLERGKARVSLFFKRLWGRICNWGRVFRGGCPFGECVGQACCGVKEERRAKRRDTDIEGGQMLAERVDRDLRATQAEDRKRAEEREDAMERKRVEQCDKAHKLPIASVVPVERHASPHRSENFAH